MNIIRKISKNRNHYGGINPCKYITVHQTGNLLKGANALKHANFIDNGAKQTWHYTVDSEQVVQHFEDTIRCWHCGDGRGAGNMQSIGVELCINKDGDYMKTIYNAVELIAHLCKKHNISHSNIKQHYDWSKKDCPKQIRAGEHGVTWNKFKALLYDKVNHNATVQIPKEDESTYKLALEVIAGKYGDGKTRKKLLGSRYDSVQTRVNSILKSKVK